MLDEIKVKGRCISLWHTHHAGKPNEAYSLDMVLQDEHVCFQLFISFDKTYRHYSIVFRFLILNADQPYPMHNKA